MANEFRIKNGFFSEGSSNITGSLQVTGGITGSLQGIATSASFASTASFLIGGVTIDTGSLVTTSSFNAYTGSAASQFAGTASFATATTLLIRRSDYTASIDPNINLLYLGEAVNGSAESSTVWTISQLSISSSGATVTRTTSSAAWTNRYSYTYL